MIKYKCSLLVVRDMEKSLNFYCKLLGLRVVADFGANKTLTGGVVLQTLDTWKNFIEMEQNKIVFGSFNTETYFETDRLDEVMALLTEANCQFVHTIKVHEWGQRALRVLDPDMHIVEIGETIETVARRFAAEGMSTEQIANKMGVPVAFARRWLKD